MSGCIPGLSGPGGQAGPPRFGHCAAHLFITTLERPLFLATSVFHQFSEKQ